jgi:hypothetical protein
MTAQIPDILLLQDRAFSIVGVNGQGLFDPADYDLRPFARITSCWRGYVCEYKVLGSEFLLNKLKINLGANQLGEEPRGFISEAGPPINAVRPVLATDNHDLFSNTYHDLNLRVGFTGGLLAADDFIRELYVHMGFHPAWKYRKVFELVIAHGSITETRDVSEQMQQIRNRMTQSQLEPGTNATKQEMEAWVAATFKLDYRL